MTELLVTVGHVLRLVRRLSIFGHASRLRAGVAAELLDKFLLFFSIFIDEAELYGRLLFLQLILGYGHSLLSCSGSRLPLVLSSLARLASLDNCARSIIVFVFVLALIMLRQ